MLDFKLKIHKKSISLLLIVFCLFHCLFAQTMYWENPVTITQTDSRFPQAISNNGKSYIFWEEIDTENKQIFLSVRKYEFLNEYTENRRFAGPFLYSGDEVPDIFTATINKQGRIVVSVMADLGQIIVFSSDDSVDNFNKTHITSGSQIMVAPRVYVTKNNSFRMFTSVGENESFTIFTSESKDGVNWSRFVQFSPVVNYKNPFIPVLLTEEKGNIVVFQAQYTSPETNRFSYQLYMTNDFHGSWSAPILITGRNSFEKKERIEFSDFQNQRASLYNYNGEIYLAWERTKNTNASIWVAKITESGLVSGTAEEITSKGNASRPVFFEYKDSLYLNWFDTRRGVESIYMAQKSGSYWNEITLIENKNSNMFISPLVLLESNNENSEKTLSFVWQQVTQREKAQAINAIAILSPDKTVNSPILYPISYKKGKASRSENVTIRINFPEDSSKIAGYSYTWGKDNFDNPVENIQHFIKENTLKLKATENGLYTLRVKVSDYAGNWSEVCEISYELDLTPPEKPTINFSNVDKYGFIDSNNFRLQWSSSVSDDVAGYSYRIDYLGEIPKSIMVSKKHPMKLGDEKVNELLESLFLKYEKDSIKKRKMPQSVMTTGYYTPRYYNKANGVYVLSVSAIDEVGNVSEPSVSMFVLNKFQPSTYITTVEKKETETGEELFSINGGGFTYDGTVSEIYIDKDGKTPYDLVLKKENYQYRVVSDKKISNINIGSDLEEGLYRIGLFHTDRGLYFSEKSIINVDKSGTLKIESDYKPISKLSINFTKYKYKIAICLIVVFVLFVLVFTFIFFLFIFVTNSLYDNKLIYKELKALKTGAAMPLSQKKHLIKRMPSLKKKLMGFTFALIFVVVLTVSLWNGYNVIRLQEQTMAAGLQNRTEVLLESLHSGVKNFLPANNVLELTALPSQKDAMEEVKYITIIGQKVDEYSPEKINYVWATNDSNILEKIENEQKNVYSLSYGESELKDDNILKIVNEVALLDKKISDSCIEYSNQIESLDVQARLLYGSGENEDAVEADLLSSEATTYRNRIDEILTEYSKGASSSFRINNLSQRFDTQNLDRVNTDFIFYRPVMYRKGTTNNYVHGMIYLELSTQSLIDSLNQEIRRIILFSTFVALGTVIVGIVGAYLFATLIVRPIKKLESHVIMVGRTKNKAMLKGKDVTIKSKDEVGRLGVAINNMTHELVLNAEEEALAMDGKAVQKAFLPLIDSGINNKNTFAEYLDNQVQCFGYYEGESGVSGDYFDYKRLDENWFTIIKCDASGHGIPAAIIMTVVATIYRRYFQNWSFAKNGTKLNHLVEQINDFIEDLGLKGKFATLIICLLNVKTGECYMCNAGDNLVHIYDSKTKSMKLITLSSAPTAGIFTSDLVAMRGGFKVEKTILNHGDVLFLYTDGIEESTRRIRELDYSVRQNEVEVRHMNPKTHEEEVEIKKEDAKEEFGPERIKEIIECVYNKKKFILSKHDNPVADEVLEFDFTKCEGTVNEAIMALASLEKVFRLFKSSSVQQTDYVKVDKNIDEFLSKYFNMYEFYASNKSGNTENNTNYVDYDMMQEDEQSDDLTLLAIKRI